MESMLFYRYRSGEPYPNHFPCFGYRKSNNTAILGKRIGFSWNDHLAVPKTNYLIDNKKVVLQFYEIAERPKVCMRGRTSPTTIRVILRRLYLRHQRSKTLVLVVCGLHFFCHGCTDLHEYRLLPLHRLLATNGRAH